MTLHQTADDTMEFRETTTFNWLGPFSDKPLHEKNNDLMRTTPQPKSHDLVAGSRQIYAPYALNFGNSNSDWFPQIQLGGFIDISITPILSPLDILEWMITIMHV